MATIRTMKSTAAMTAGAITRPSIPELESALIITIIIIIITIITYQVEKKITFI